MRGVTLVELLVVLAITGLVAGMSALAIGGLRRSEAGLKAQKMSQARSEALREGRARTFWDDTAAVRFLPDGRAIGASVDPLTGVPLDADH